MRSRRLRGALVLTMVAAALAPAAVASSAGAPSPAAATTAFGRLLHQLYGPFRGYWTCPAAQSFDGRVECMGEVEAVSRWHQVDAAAQKYHGIVDFHVPYAVTWTRHWSPFSRHYILRSNEAQVPGVVSVNSPAYDWGWLAGMVEHLKAGARTGADAYDGNGAGWSRFYGFDCSRSGGTVTCRNKLGDAMRYRPHG